MTDRQADDLFDRAGTLGQQAAEKETRLGSQQAQQNSERARQFGLAAADSVQDRTITTFVRGDLPHFSGINTLLKVPFLEDIRRVGEYDVAFVGLPFDTGTTYRPGSRFGPQAMRRISALYTGYFFELGVDLIEAVKMCDVGDVFTVPGNLEKSFDQVSRAVSHVFASGAFPFLMGGDHSLGFPNLRGIAPHVDGNIGIIHLDRHVDIQEKDLDERMHSCPWFHATNLPNAPAANLVQIGIGGWQVPRAGVREARKRGIAILSMDDVEHLGIEKVAEIALEIAWKNARAVYLSFDIDCVDAGFVPGTGWPEPGGFLPREALRLLRLIAREGICGMEVVELSPPYDVSDVTALLAVRAMLDVLATLVDANQLPRRTLPAWFKPAGLDAWKGR